MYQIDRQSVYCPYIKWLHTILQNKMTYKEDMKFQNICLYKTSKVAVLSARNKFRCLIAPNFS